MRDAREWEATTLVPWAMHLPRGAGARDIADLLTSELRLQQGQVTVTLHQPEPYLIRFANATDTAAASRRGRFTGRGIDICLGNWRSLSHALGLRLFYRVRLCLDGIPSHAWSPDIVERVVGRRCAVQCIITNLVELDDTRHIELWAWVVDPSEIPRRVWLAFTNRPADNSSMRFFVTTEPPPETWHNGARYEVFIHLALLEDYTAAERMLEEGRGDPMAIVPICRRFIWRFGLVDGSPPEARSRYPARLPKPPRTEHSGTAAQDDGRRLSNHYTEQEERGRVDRARDTRHARDRDGDFRRARNSHDEPGRGRTSQGRSSCNDKPFTWPHHPGDDDEGDGGDYTHPGRGSDGNKYGDKYWGVSGVRRDRTRSPPRRHYGSSHGSRHAVGTEEAGLPPQRRVSRAHLAAFSPRLPSEDELRAMSKGCLQALFAAQAHGLRNHLQEQVLVATSIPSLNCDAQVNKDDWLHGATEYISKATALASRLGIQEGIEGERAWSATVPVKRVFTRLTSALVSTKTPSVFVEDVERALDAMTLVSRLPGPSGAGPHMEDHGTLGTPNGTRGDGATAQSGDDGAAGNITVGGAEFNNDQAADNIHGGRTGGSVLMRRHCDDISCTAAAPGPNRAAQQEVCNDTSPGGVPGLAGETVGPVDGPAQQLAAQQTDCIVYSPVGLPGPSGETRGATDEPAQDLSAGLQAEAQHSALTSTRVVTASTQANVTGQLDDNSVRRSARLAKKPNMPVTEKAQRNLCRKLGILQADVDLSPIDKVVQEIINTFNGPLPTNMVAAMTALFDLEDDDAERINEAILHQAGEAALGMEEPATE